MTTALKLKETPHSQVQSGTGTTTVAAAKTGRNSVGFEIDEHYFDMARKRIENETSSLFSKNTIEIRGLVSKG